MSGITSRELNQSLRDQILQGGSGVGGGTVHVGDRPPANQTEGGMWFQTGFGGFDPTQVPLIINNVVIQDDEPTEEQLKDGNNLWYDLI